MEKIITSAESGMTIKQYLALEKFSARLITRLKSKATGITVNGERKTVRYILTTGDLLYLDTSDESPSKNITLSHIPIEILYEDEYFIAVAKPPHLPIHPSRRHINDTLASRVMAHFENKNFVFRVLTRLDLNTSGAVLIAKSSIAAAAFSRMLAERRVDKTYLAVCNGIFENDSGEINFNIRRTAPQRMEREAVEKGIGGNENSAGGMQALTRYNVISRGETTTVVHFYPITGRTHQLRVHSKAIGHPIVGDTLYSHASPYIDRQALHAEMLSFIHPFTSEKINIVAPIPNDIKELING